MAGEGIQGAQALIARIAPGDLKGSGAALLVTGPTGIGKSELAMALARDLDGEIVSVDSCAVYKGFDIGSAKPDARARKKVPHHLVDIREPAEQYSAGDFYRDAQVAVAKVHAKGRTPILCGGTMMYVNALLNGLHSIPPVPKEIHLRMKEFVRQEGAPAAHARLQEKDPATARRLSPNDSQRLVRALGVHEATGTPLGEWIAGSAASPPFALVPRYLVPSDRKCLSQGLRARFVRMVEAGFVAEVRKIIDGHGAGIDPLRSVGYKQIAAHVQGELSLDEAIEKGVAATRRLVKSQMTWVRKLARSGDETVSV